MTTFMLKGNLRVCQRQLTDTAPGFHEAIDDAIEAHPKASQHAGMRNCAMEAFEQTARIAGLLSNGTKVVVAGLAGGLGLTGNACGALAATVFALTLKYFIERNKPKHSLIRSNLQGLQLWDGWLDPSREVLRRFKERFGTKLCSRITGTTFEDNDSLYDFLQKGNCNRVVSALSSEVREVNS
jgi:hypothetical protein